MLWTGSTTTADGGAQRLSRLGPPKTQWRPSSRLPQSVRRAANRDATSVEHVRADHRRLHAASPSRGCDGAPSGPFRGHESRSCRRTPIARPSPTPRSCACERRHGAGAGPGAELQAAGADRARSGSAGMAAPTSSPASTTPRVDRRCGAGTAGAHGWRRMKTFAVHGD